MLVYQSGAVFLTQHQLNINSTDLLNNGRKKHICQLSVIPQKRNRFEVGLPCLAEEGVLFFWIVLPHQKHLFFQKKKAKGNHQIQALQV